MRLNKVGAKMAKHTPYLIYFTLFLSFLWRPTNGACQPKNLKIKKPKEIRLFPKDVEETRITLNFDPEPCTEDASFLWQLDILEDSSRTIPGVWENSRPTKEPINHLNLTNADKKTKFYDYKFEINVQLIPSDGSSPVSAKSKFVVAPHPIDVIIEGGPVREYVLGVGNLVLDGRKSNDPSFWEPQDLTKHNIITWDCIPKIGNVKGPDDSLVWEINFYNLRSSNIHNCTLTLKRKGMPLYTGNKEYSASQQIKVKRIPKADFKVVCVENCNPSNPYKDTLLMLDCKVNCEGSEPIWLVAPYKKNIMEDYFVKGPSEIPFSYRFKANAFKPNEVITITVWIREVAESLVLTFKQFEIKLKLSCRENCNYDGRKPIVIAAGCTPDEFCAEKDYEWEIQPPVDNVTEFLNAKREILTIPAGTYQGKKDVTVKLSNWGGKDTFKFTTTMPAAEIIIHCTSMKPKGEDNCADVDPRDTVTLEAKCLSNCFFDFQEFKWDTAPQPKNFHPEDHTSNNNTILKIPPRTFLDNQKVNLSVVLGTTTATYTLRYREKIANITIHCQENCKTPANPTIETVLNGVCNDNCAYVYFEWKVWDDKQAVKADQVKAWISEDKKTFRMPKDTIPDETEVKVSLESENARSEWKANFSEPVAKIAIKCLVNCDGVKVFNPLQETIFGVDCNDTAEVHCPDKYEWSMEPKNISFASKILKSENGLNITIRESSFEDGDIISITVRGRKSEVSKNITFKEPIPELDLKCLDNCEPSHPALPVEVQVICRENCFGVKYHWDIETLPEGFTWFTAVETSPNNETLTIRANTFQGGTDVVIKLITKRVTKSLKTQFKMIPAVVKITCDPPCEDIHNPLFRIYIKVACVKYCFRKLEYEWAFDPVPEGFNWTKSILMQVNNESLLVLPETFMDETEVAVTVKDTNDAENGTAAAEVNTTLIFREPTPVVSIECESNCWESDPFLDTKLLAKCTFACENATRYTWELDPPPSDWKKNITGGPFNNTLKILAGTYEDGTQVNVTLFLRKGNNTRTLNFIEEVPILEITCQENCDLMNPLKNITLKVTCRKISGEKCGKEEFLWNIEPVNEGFTMEKNVVLGPNNATLTILGYSFNDTNVTAVTVTNRKASQTQVLNFREPKPKFYITCVINCLNGISNPLLPMSFNATCYAACDRLKYLWHLLPPPATTDWQSKIEYGKVGDLDNVTFYIQENVYRDEESTRIKVTSLTGEDKMDIHFIEPVPVLNLFQECTSDCVQYVNETYIANPFENITFKVQCVHTCQNISFEWEVEPQLREFEWNTSAILGQDNVTLTIINGTYLDTERAVIIAKSRKAKIIANLLYLIPPPNLTIECATKENCPEPNPLLNVTLRLKCKYLCDNFTYDWKILPPQPKPWQDYLSYQQSSQDGFQTVTIKANSFQHDDEITFIALHQNVTGNFSLTFIEPDPVIKIECLKNCKFNPRDEVKLEVKCLKHCEELNYEWTLIPESLQLTEINRTSKDFIILESSYPDNSTVEVNVKVRSSEDTYTIHYELPMWKGACYSEPSKGTSGITEYMVECDDLPSGATFRVYQAGEKDDHQGVLLTYGTKSISQPFLVSKTDGKTHKLKVVVGMGWESKTTVPLNMTADSFKPPKDTTLNTKDYLKLIILGTGEKAFNTFIEDKKYLRVVQMASFLTTALEESEDGEFQVHSMKHLLSGLLKIANHLEPTQCESIVRKMMDEKSPVLGDSLALSLAMEIMKICSESMLKEKTNIRYSNHTILEDFATMGLQLASRLLEAGYKLKTEAVDSDHPLHLPSVAIRENIKIMTLNMFDIVASIEKVLGRTNKTTNIESHHVKLLTANRQLNGSEDIFNFTLPGVSSHITSPLHFPQILQKVLDTKNVSLDYRMTAYNISPMWWDADQTKITTEVLEFSISGVKTLPSPLNMYLKVATNTEPKQETFEAKNDGILMVREYELVGKSTFSVNFSHDKESFHAYVGLTQPTDEFTNEFGNFVNTTMTLYHQGSGTVYVSIMAPKKGNYKFSYKAMTCYSWGDDELLWRTDHCTASHNQIQDHVHCECTHLSYFAAGEYLPARIHEGEGIRLHEKMQPSYAAIYCLAIASAIFLILFFWALSKDLRLQKSNVVDVLRDTFPGDRELYLVLIATGMAWNAGTTSEVGIFVTGSEASSRLHLLIGKHLKRLKRNTEQFCVMYAPKYLGDLQSIRLWHNSQGRNPDWYCERIIIEHLKTRRRYTFIVEKWLSLSRCDGKAHGDFKVSNNTPPMPFGRRFRETLRVDHHLLSLYCQRPREGAYKETVAVGFVSLMWCMMVAMLFVTYWQISMVAIGALSALCTLPITYSLQFLFRNSP